MSTKDSGGPAFPTPDRGRYEPSDGMTLRDYFAAKAVCAILHGNISREADMPYKVAANAAYRLADAMLKERAK
jgi:hypothetical protein